MIPAGSTQVDWPLRVPRPGEAECAGRVAKLMARQRVAIDRDRVSPDSSAERSGVGRPAGWRHSSPVTGLRNRREVTCFRAFSGTTGASRERSDAAAWRHSSADRESPDDENSLVSNTYRRFGGSRHRSYAASWQHNSGGRLPAEPAGSSAQAALRNLPASCRGSDAAAWRHNSADRESPDDDMSVVSNLSGNSVASGNGAMLRVGSIVPRAGYPMSRLEPVFRRLCRFRRRVAVGAMSPLGGIVTRKRHRSVRPKALVLWALTGIGARILPKYAARGI